MESTTPKRGKPQVSFPEQVQQIVDDSREQALEELEDIAKDALTQVIKSMTGASYDRWDHVWKFEDYPSRRSAPLMNALQAKAEELAPAIIEQALAEPISFTQKDLSALRTLLKDAVIQEASDLLREKAHSLAQQAIDALARRT